MTHRSDAELQAYLDAELQGGDAADVAAHLMTCTECRSRLGELRLAGERLRAALAELESGLLPDASRLPRSKRPAQPDVDRVASDSRVRPGRSGFGAGRSLARAAVMLLAVAGAAAAVVPGSPLRLLIERLVSNPVVSIPVEPPDARAEPESVNPGIASVTVSPAEGRVRVMVRQFPRGTVIRVRLEEGRDVRARLLSGQEGVRFSVGTGSLYMVGSESGEPSEILIDLPRGLNSATLEVDGKRELVASGGAFLRPGGSGELPQDEVVLRVGG
jgi:anti-sigma factor RsiW